MKNYLLLGTLVLFCVILYSCIEENNIETGLKSPNGFPQNPTNLSIVNSEYDDYNSDMPKGEFYKSTLTFSSNRDSKGGNFNIVLKSLDISYRENEVKISESHGYSEEFMQIRSMLNFVNTNNSELGPYVFNCVINNKDSDKEFLFFYTQDSLNKQKIKFGKATVESYQDRPGIYFYVDGPYNLDILNSEQYSVGYISIQDNNIYYNSNIDGNYDLYELKINTSMNLIDFISQKHNLQSQAKKILSSNEDDKCPFVVDSLLIFTSKRAGGQGGFDLWYSKLTNNEWTEAINFGPHINTHYDEYRPIVIRYPKIPNDLMIFSSNRPEGSGGFDLYYMGTTLNRK